MSWSVVLAVAGIWTLAGLIVAVVIGGMFRQMDDAEEHEADVDRHRAAVKFMRSKKKVPVKSVAIGSAGCPVASQTAATVGRRQAVN